MLRRETGDDALIGLHWLAGRKGAAGDSLPMACKLDTEFSRISSFSVIWRFSLSNLVNGGREMRKVNASALATYLYGSTPDTVRVSQTSGP